MSGYPAVLATKKRALQLGASFIEQDLKEMRGRITEREEQAREFEERHPEAPKHVVFPDTTSHEGDFMKATEWASALTWLRALAELEENPK